MKKVIVFMMLVFLAATNLPAQDQKQNNLPHEQITVNKKFNEKGELTGYDSTAIFTWKTDTTFSIAFPFDSLPFNRRFHGIEQFMNEFFNDSAFGNTFPGSHPFTFGFRVSPFESQPHTKIIPSIPDSLFRDNFPFRFDSLLFNFDFVPSKPYTDEFSHKFMEDFEERMNRYFFDNKSTIFPQFKTEEQRKEWEQLMEKHRRERESLRQQWQEQKKQE